MRDKSLEMLVENIAEEFMRLRNEQGISHDKLAEMTGLSRPAISFIENHKRVPTILTCAKIAKALGVNLSDVIAKFEE